MLLRRSVPRHATIVKGEQLTTYLNKLRLSSQSVWPGAAPRSVQDLAKTEEKPVVSSAPSLRTRCSEILNFNPPINHASSQGL